MMQLFFYLLTWKNADDFTAACVFHFSTHKFLPFSWETNWVVLRNIVCPQHEPSRGENESKHWNFATGVSSHVAVACICVFPAVVGH